ncbi:hypothetical protein GCM10007962_00950 [Yeosuana aromativorans]|uniref:DUF3575 domain-containing protein n=1 Tax=Yeosuana aromativorans TaxID=288019 RepID=A0A8J3BKL9_9FLAO|nr:DUF3575 domain-containing protein [Yeosuana aromativorans]GGK10640.1 hypothetical protein GCM10007962_00950 [Yeosuana aromativorans]
MTTKQHLKTVLFLVALAFGISNASLAQDMANSKKDKNKFKNSISFCPAALAFGIYSVNYEYLLNKKHGLVARFDYEAIPKTYTNTNIKSNGKAFIVNYRYHFSEQMKSFFVGAYGRYRIYNGTGVIEGNNTTENENFSFDMPDWTAGINAGKKWVWNSGFNITLSFGYGFSNESWNASSNITSVDNAIKDFRKAYDFIDPFYGEFSIGYSF